MSQSKDLSFASFNLYNLQKPGVRFHQREYTQAEYDAKIAWTATTLRRVDADVVGFQELWHKDCLEEAFEAAGLSADYETVYIGDSWYQIAVAAAIRAPWRLKRKLNIKQFPEKARFEKVNYDDGEDDEVEVRINRFSRTVLKLTLEHPAVNVPDVTVFLAHLKAKLPSNVREVASRYRSAVGTAISAIRRTAEATALRVHLTDQMKATHAPTVVIGDLNDDPRSNALAILTEQPNLGPSARGTDTGLYSVLALQQLQSLRDVYYTHEFKGVRDTLDHILVSEEMFRNSRDAKWWFDRATVLNDSIDDESVVTSDHGVISARFRWGR